MRSPGHPHPTSDGRQRSEPPPTGPPGGLRRGRGKMLGTDVGDFEWILAFEADELHRIVDLMRDLRASKARLHVRTEIPFYTGRRHPVAELTALWP